MRHPLVLIAVFPLMASPGLLLTSRTSPDWRSGVLAPVDQVMWVALAGLYLSFILWTLWRWMRFRNQELEIGKFLSESEERFVVVGRVDPSIWKDELDSDEPLEPAWILVDKSSKSAHACWIAGDQLMTHALRTGTPIRDLRIAPSSYAPGADPEMIIEFQDLTELETRLIGPYSKIFPLNLRALQRRLEALNGSIRV